MNKKPLILTASLLLLTGCSWFGRNQTPTPTPTPTVGVSQEQINSTREQLEERTGVKLPTAAPTQVPNPNSPNTPTQAATNRKETVLSDQTQGGASGLAVRQSQGTTHELTILADLPDLEGTQFYQVWIVRGQAGSQNYSIRPLSKLSTAKGGYLLEYTSQQDFSDHNEVIITRETQNDQTPEQIILRGSF